MPIMRLKVIADANETTIAVVRASHAETLTGNFSCNCTPIFVQIHTTPLFYLEINRKGRRQIGLAQLAGLSAETFLQFLVQPRGKFQNESL